MRITKLTRLAAKWGVILALGVWFIGCQDQGNKGFNTVNGPSLTPSPTDTPNTPELTATLGDPTLTPSPTDTPNTPELTATSKVFKVVSRTDNVDLKVGDGDCWCGTKTLDGLSRVEDCTLRAAVQEANAHKGKDLITFAVPGAQIYMDGQLQITDTIVIDGSTQKPEGLIGLNFPEAVTGLRILAGDSEINRLSIVEDEILHCRNRGSIKYGLTLETSGRNKITNNEIIWMGLSALLIDQSNDNIIENNVLVGGRNVLDGNPGIFVKSGNGNTFRNNFWDLKKQFELDDKDIVFENNPAEKKTCSSWSNN